MSDVAPRPTQTAQPRWRPMAAIDRRVMGVLVEKAKTTPDAYPMSTSALRSGCNQKNNRFPLMEIEVEDVEESLARLRAVGAVTEVQGGGRVARFRHHLYEWLGVDKVELAVMAELLLRGAQTEGELRGRAARMEPIADLAALRPVLASLKQKGLVIALTPEGRGHMLTHALYEPRELDKVRAEAAAGGMHEPSAAQHELSASEHPRGVAPAQPSSPADGNEAAMQKSIDSLRHELDEVRGGLAKLRADLDELWSQFR
jgi:uncharacterized protein